ncbi:DUF1653 domain-containing protein [Candidatus Woesearchaeota archaeon]|nr:DUF1653 domain-containing protein [Candidatus Woesearchaeota archaeon]
MSEQTQPTIKLGIYQHFKNVKEYRVLGIGTHSETLEELVVYQARYEDSEFGPEHIWLRPKNNFFQMVEYQGKTVPRFKYLRSD